MENKEFMSIMEVAKLLGITRQSVHKQVKNGRIEAIKIGRSYAIPTRKILARLRGKLGDADKERIKKIVKRAVEEYGEALKLLGNE